MHSRSIFKAESQKDITFYFGLFSRDSPKVINEMLMVCIKIGYFEGRN
jgi:hypothetical protein